MCVSIGKNVNASYGNRKLRDSLLVRIQLSLIRGLARPTYNAMQFLGKTSLRGFSAAYEAHGCSCVTLKPPPKIQRARECGIDFLRLPSRRRKLYLRRVYYRSGALRNRLYGGPLEGLCFMAWNGACVCGSLIGTAVCKICRLIMLRAVTNTF